MAITGYLTISIAAKTKEKADKLKRKKNCTMDKLINEALELLEATL